jgi:hypothetical protein
VQKSVDRSISDLETEPPSRMMVFASDAVHSPSDTVAVVDVAAVAVVVPVAVAVVVSAVPVAAALLRKTPSFFLNDILAVAIREKE